MKNRAVRFGVVLGGAMVVLTSCGSSKSPSMIDSKGNEAKHIAGVWWLMFTLAAAVYVVVAGFIVYAIRRRHSDQQEPQSDQADTGAQRFDDRMIVWGGVAVPLVILLVLAVVTVRTTDALRRPERNALRVEVVGKRWWWAVTYPTARFTTANEVHLPAGRPIELGLTSDNVIHSFWVPQLAGKLDMIPGQRNILRIRASAPGVYEGLCAEFCGVQHAHMMFTVIVQTAGDFDRWLAQRSQPPLEPASESAAQGAVAFNRLPCAGCHTIAGTQANGTLGPELTDIASRRDLGAGTVTNDPQNLARWITDAPSLKPGALMPPIAMTGSEVQSIVAYLESLK